ncbi:hypothetical protein FC83_GL001242 [Agrilactobacillus composti DSM 18527 = JCM 14202]|uniref:NAD(P)-binding domain-containing protein n=1 Tax=Agrilactobacillus composti DSM 18527 = JCM 14202 TaxID=1423734 RepID=X0PES0_9LACO|nr:SDR family oxidoreductase [Agrilactobacillus composti]KRM35115.1 hypothetical protein FC83_GL001242 [Agrilactobacillus composti DSM 18527 = JCM 14202]GAF40264.1 hypothetical protein JCM14202_2155 [Agrilactobacillus composti DSM 18527 = JCM 14202]
MKVFIIGAHGKVAQLLIPKLVQSGHTVYGGIHNTAQTAAIEQLGATPVSFDLLGPVTKMAQTLQGMDAVVFSAGAGGGSYDRTLLIDLDGAVKSMEAAKMAGVKRYVMVSSAASNHRQTWGDVIRPYMAAKFYADRALVQSGLAYTIVRPGMLTNDPETGLYQLGIGDKGSKQITRGDVAQFINGVLAKPATSYQAYDIVNGSNQLSEILN